MKTALCFLATLPPHLRDFRIAINAPFPTTWSRRLKIRTIVERLLWNCTLSLCLGFSCPFASLSAATFGNFIYTDNGADVEITGSVTAPSGPLTIPDIINGKPVTSIGDTAFYGYNNSELTSVSIPASVTNIGHAAFGGCPQLTAITVDASNPAYSTTADGVLFNKDYTTLLLCPGGKAGTYTVPNSVTSIGDQAFIYCVHLTGVTIPASVTNIHNHAFYQCRNLTSITVDALNTAYSSSADGILFNKNKTSLIVCPIVSVTYSTGRYNRR